MALAVDAVSNSGSKDPADPWTWSHTCTGTELVLVVAVSCYNATVSAVTYNGDAMTVVAGATITSGSFTVSLYYLINPDTGTNTVSVDLSTSGYGSAGAISFTGANQTTQPDAAAEESGTSLTTNVLNITTVTDGTYIVDALSLDTTWTDNNLNEAVSQTEITRQFPTFVDTGQSYKAVASAGAQTMTWTWTVSPAFAATYVHAGIAIKAAAGGVAVTPKGPFLTTNTSFWGS